MADDKLSSQQTNNKQLAIVVLSGGMDSTVCVAITKDQGYDLALMHLDYGQRTEDRERKAFFDIADYYKAKYKLLIKAHHLKQIGGSALTDEKLQIPVATLDEINKRKIYKIHNNKQDIPITYVPFRNANILSMAISWAEVINAAKVVIGAVQEDSSGYPDCTEEFLSAFEKAAKIGSKLSNDFKIEAPLLHLSKKQIVELGYKLKVPFDLTWSCYQSNDIACGECESCILRLKGFIEANIKDPIKYKNR